MGQAAHVRAEVIASHIEKPSVRERVRKELANFFDDLETITRGEDNSRYNEEKDDKYDHIHVISPQDWRDREDRRLEELKTANFFTPSPIFNVSDTDSDVNAKGKFGYTKLIKAVVDHDLELINELLDNPEVDIDATDNSGDTALDKAQNRGYDDVIALFEGRGILV
jgi:ankyrin repeat protein